MDRSQPRLYPSMREYIEDAKGWYWVEATRDGAWFWKDLMGMISTQVYASPCAVVDRADGTSGVYGHAPYEYEGTRKLYIVRLPDHAENPYYEDRWFESLITLPVIPIFKGWIFTCNTCGRQDAFEEHWANEAEGAARRHGWVKSTRRGWQCPRHAMRHRRLRHETTRRRVAYPVAIASAEDNDEHRDTDTQAS